MDLSTKERRPSINEEEPLSFVQSIEQPPQIVSDLKKEIEKLTAELERSCFACSTSAEK